MHEMSSILYCGRFTALASLLLQQGEASSFFPSACPSVIERPVASLQRGEEKMRRYL